jgi:predicted nucleic acid-binding protein
MGALSDLAGKRVYLDAKVFIYALDNLPPCSQAAAALLRAVEAGEFSAVTSELALAECLVKLLQPGSAESARVYEQTVSPSPHLNVVPVSRELLIEAARIRAAGAVKLPGAIHLAASRLHGCDVFFTNDERIRAAPWPEVPASLGVHRHLNIRYSAGVCAEGVAAIKWVDGTVIDCVREVEIKGPAPDGAAD